MKKTVILGVGNILFSDEGIGIHAVKEISKWSLPENVSVFDGGTLGILCAHMFEGADTLILIDAVAADKPAGTVLQYSKDDIMLNHIPVKLSPHQIGIQETLLVSELRGNLPREIIFYGAVPASYDTSDKLTEEGEKALKDILEEIKKLVL